MTSIFKNGEKFSTKSLPKFFVTIEITTTVYPDSLKILILESALLVVEREILNFN
jgi:hypothetical protein